MSPTVFRYKGYKFFFFSREEERMHIHVLCSEGEAKFWMEPKISIAKNSGLKLKSLAEIGRLLKSTKTKSGKRGKGTLEVEVQNISRFGVWILIRGNEYYLPHKEYPWFKNATAKAVKNVRLLSPRHLHWPDLDVDLEVESLKYPDKYPLKARLK